MQTPHAYERLTLSTEMLALALNQNAAVARLPDVLPDGSGFFAMPGLPARNF